jgi:oligopeptide/dipeptide ABC transporter ATP-binding protein
MTLLLEVKDLKKTFRLGSFFSGHGQLTAVDGISFTLNEEETLCVVGESGCGKTTLARIILLLIEPTEAAYIRFMGRDILKLQKKEIRKLRGQMQIVFQSPAASLNPQKTIKHIISQPLLIHKTIKREEVDSEVRRLASEVGLIPPEEFLERRPPELSGGQKQRVAIARAIATRPKMVVCDEPVSQLDLSVQGKILKLLKDLQEKYKTAYIFVTHDLNVARSIADRVMVMYLGRIMELADVEAFYRDPRHPYSKGILAATPVPDPKRASQKKRFILGGEPPSPMNIPSGCRFHPRCPICNSRCKKEEPILTDVGGGHLVACHFAVGDLAGAHVE